MRDGAQITTTGASAATKGGARPRLDDLVCEVGEQRRLGGRTVRTIWSFGGFLIGAVLWQAIGVWSLLGSAVLEPSKPAARVLAEVTLHASASNCTALALDRLSGRTHSVPCAGPMPRLEAARNASGAGLTVAHASPAAQRPN